MFAKIKEVWGDFKEALLPAGAGLGFVLMAVGLFSLLFLGVIGLCFTISAAFIYAAWNWVIVGLFSIGAPILFWPHCYGLVFVFWVLRMMLFGSRTSSS